VEAKADSARNFWGTGEGDYRFVYTCWGNFWRGPAPCFFWRGSIWIFIMSTQPTDFSGFIVFFLILCFFMIAYCIGILVHSSLMYEDKNNIGKNSRSGWVLSMVAGAGITGWMFYYGYYVNFLR
jgi:hypothetical protein